MRALRSRPISDNTDNESNEEGNYVKRKKSKKYLPDVSEENVDKSEEQVVKKKSKKSKKKHAKEDTNTSTETVLQEVHMNTENSSENDNHSKKRLKKKKSKKLKKSQDENNLSTSAHSTEIETEVSTNRKLDHSIENGENSLQPLKKKSKKVKKMQHENLTPENSSENDENSKQHVKKKSKKLKKLPIENQSTSTVLSTTVDIEEKSLKKKRHLRSTIACSPNFNNAITSTLMKPSRRQLTELNVNEIEGHVASPRLNRLTRQERMSERINIVNKRQETPLKSITLDKIDDNSSIKSRKSSLGLSPKTKEVNGTDTLQKSSRSSRGSSLGISSISTADCGSFVKSKMSTSFKNSSVLNNSKTKQENNKITNITTSVIAISDSPDISKVKQNTFNKSESISGEDTLKEKSIKEESQEKISPTNRRETFIMLPKNKHLIDDSIITISDTPDKTTKRSTFNKTEIESDKTFYKSNRSTKSSESNESTLTKDQSMNQTNIKAGTSFLSEVGESILENTVDILETPEKTTNSFLKNETYDLEENMSGDWKVEKNEKIDKSKPNKTQNKENQSEGINKSPPEIAPISPKDQSIRKKWLKFPRHSSDAKQVLDQISSPKLQKKMNNASLAQKIMNTPKELYTLQKPSVAPSNLSLHSKSSKKTPIIIKKSPMKSARKAAIGSSSKKSTSKRTVMPNFALIHQKAFDKMENLKEYSERKQKRAQALLSSKKPESTIKTTEKKTEEPKAKSSRQLFNNDCKNTFNRFGFKMTEFKPVFSAKPEKKIEIVKPVIKPSVFARSDVVAIANKKVATKTRENKREILKGVRTNRRFELLMQMRNK